MEKIFFYGKTQTAAVVEVDVEVVNIGGRLDSQQTSQAPIYERVLLTNITIT